jgi:hypothetical protein
MSGQHDPSPPLPAARGRRRRAPAEIAVLVHRRVLARRIAQSGRTREQIVADTGWRESRLLHLLDPIGPMKYEDLFAVLELIGVAREVFFEEVCQVLAALEGDQG